MRDMEIKNKRTVTRRVEERDNGRNKGNMYKGPVDKDDSVGTVFGSRGGMGQGRAMQGAGEWGQF